jgi:cytoskeletal protein CcmA (bactofilin family)
LTKPENGSRSESIPAPRPEKTSTLGRALHWKGELAGEEDLSLEGTFQGRIDLKNHRLYIDQTAKVEADVIASDVTIRGSLTGNVTATGHVLLASGASLKGDISAAKVSIEEGARFSGAIRIKS